jgi:hypothetical protein
MGSQCVPSAIYLGTAKVEIQPDGSVHIVAAGGAPVQVQDSLSQFNSPVVMSTVSGGASASGQANFFFNGTHWMYSESGSTPAQAFGAATVTANTTVNRVPYLSATNVYSDSPVSVGSGMVGINLGTVAPPTMFAVGDTASTTPRGLMSWQASNDTASAHLHMRKSRGTFGSPLTIVSGDILGRVVYSGYEGTNYNESASIRVTSVGTIAANRVPSKMEFLTSTDAAPSVATVALTLNADQSATFASIVNATTFVGALTGTASGNLTSASGLNASNLTSGTVPSARLALAASDIPTLTLSKISDAGTMASQAEANYALLAGRSGGQTLIGGTGASENITIQSTSNSTRGYILLGTGGLVGINKSSSLGAQLHVVAKDAGTKGVRVGMAASPSASSYPFSIADSTDATLSYFGVDGSLTLPNAGITVGSATMTYSAGNGLTLPATYFPSGMTAFSNLRFRSTANYVSFGSGGGIYIASGSDSTSSSFDTSLTRSAPGVWQMGDGGANANGSLLMRYRVSAKTANYSVATGDSNTFFTNTGATGEVDFTLPTAAVGLVYTFYVDAAQTLKVIAGASTTIRVAGSVSAAAGNITNATTGGCITLIAISTTQWVAESSQGTWTVT